MNLFRKENKTSCCNKNNCIPDSIQQDEKVKTDNEIKILGSGCTNCIALENATRTAISELGLNINITHINDFSQIASYGVISTPALVINKKVVSYGKVLSVKEIKNILQNTNVE